MGPLGLTQLPLRFKSAPWTLAPISFFDLKKTVGFWEGRSVQMFKKW